jgi:hypothetical protein
MGECFAQEMVEHDDGWINFQPQGYRLPLVACHLGSLE